METTTMEAEPTTPVVVEVERASLELGTTAAPEVRVETRVDPLPGASMDGVFRGGSLCEASI
jgi:hypothetical protein